MLSGNNSLRIVATNTQITTGGGYGEFGEMATRDWSERRPVEHRCRPVLLAVAAIGSQFSAAVADDSGAGGLLEDITRKQLPVRHAYFLILLATITLTWTTDVNAIIAYASRAFALFYMFQCVVAFLVALRLKELSHRLLRLVNFAFLAVMCLLVFALGIPSG